MQGSQDGSSLHNHGPDITNENRRRNDNDSTFDSDSDLDDLTVFEGGASDVLAADPSNGAGASRSHKHLGLSLPGFLSSDITDGLNSPATPITPASPGGNLRRRHTPTIGVSGGEASNYFFGDADGPVDGQDQELKEPGASVDWYQEGPGKRVGYEDLTAIDWIFEYGKERQRLRVLLSGATGAVGQLRQVLDSSQIWLILVATGILTGAIAACIDVVSDWLGDIKQGICKAGAGGGKFYLNKTFCCWGLDELAQCQGWMFWSQALGIDSAGGGYIVEYIFFIMFSIIFAVCAAVLVKQYAPHARQSGIPEVKTMLGGFVMRRFLTNWTLVIKSVGLCLSVASGLWLGKEGPLIHVACCVANLFIQMAPILNENEARKREVISAAAAAGISVAFGAPVGGVLFSLEQLSFYFPDKTMWQSFVCAMVAAVSLQAFNPFRTGKLVLYEVRYLSQWHAFELVPFAFLGVVGGLYGGLFIKLNMLLARFRKNVRFLQNPIVEVVLIALLTAVVNFPNKFMRAQFPELVATLFSECSELKDERLGLCGSAPSSVVGFNLLAAAGLGFLLASITFGLRIPAGIILPSMAIGALFGRTVGMFTRTFQQAFPDLIFFRACPPDVRCVTAGTYAIIGAASTLAGVTRMTVSIVVIMFELTGALNYVLPIMISVMISKWVGDVFGKQGIYESWIDFYGYPFLDNRDDRPVPDIAVAQVMTRMEDIVVLNSTGHTLDSLARLLKTQPFRGFPVITSSREEYLSGYISRTELAFALESARTPPRSLPGSAEASFAHQPLADTNTTLDLRPWMDQTPITLSAKSSLQMAADMFLKLGLRYVLFCEKGVLKGLLTKKDIIFILNGAGEKRMGAGSGIYREEYAQGEQQTGLMVGEMDIPDGSHDDNIR